MAPDYAQNPIAQFILVWVSGLDLLGSGVRVRKDTGIKRAHQPRSRLLDSSRASERESKREIQRQSQRQSEMEREIGALSATGHWPLAVGVSPALDRLPRLALDISINCQSDEFDNIWQ